MFTNNEKMQIYFYRLKNDISLMNRKRDFVAIWYYIGIFLVSENILQQIFSYVNVLFFSIYLKKKNRVSKIKNYIIVHKKYKYHVKSYKFVFGIDERSELFCVKIINFWQYYWICTNTRWKHVNYRANVFVIMWWGRVSRISVLRSKTFFFFL